MASDIWQALKKTCVCLGVKSNAYMFDSPAPSGRANILSLSRELTEANRSVRSQVVVANLGDSSDKRASERVWQKNGFFGELKADFSIHKKDFPENALIYINQAYLRSKVDCIQFGRTSKRFFVLVNERQTMKKADEHQRGIFVVTIENDFTKDFCADFEKIFKQHYHDYDNILFMKYILSIIKEHVNTRFIFGHLYWCRRSTSNPNNCKFCCQVRRCWIFDKSETEFRFAYALYHYQKYDDHHERIFADTEYFTKDLNTIHKKCDYFEYVYEKTIYLQLFYQLA